MSAANCCRIAGLSEDEAERLISARMTRRPSPANEVRTAIAKAYSGSQQSSPLRQPISPSRFGRAQVPLTSLKFDPARLKAFAERVPPPGNWRHWLWERSQKRPETQNAFSFLAHLYLPGERVSVFDSMESKTPAVTVRVSTPMDCRVPAAIKAGGQYGNGIWFLCNPVDGEWHPNPRNDNIPSCRSEESVTSFRYAVLESDQAPANLWLGFIVQLPLRVAAIYTSGSRSVHCLIRVDAASKAEWDGNFQPLKRPLKIVGADPGALSAVRLTRLPGCWRPSKQGFQRLLYLCPNPPLTPLVDPAAIHSRPWTLARWRRDCLRWNAEKEADL
jgi:hypothetical protein